MLSRLLFVAALPLFLAAQKTCTNNTECNHGYCQNTTSSCACFEGWTGSECTSPDLAIHSAQGDFFIAFAVIMWMFTIPLAALMCLHNKSAPVQGRHPLLVVFAVITFLIFVTVVLLERVYPHVFSCTGFIVISVLIFGMALWTMFLRTWLVFFMFMATAERADRRQAEKSGVRVKNGWFVSHRWMTSVIAQYAIFAFGFIALLVTTIVFSVVTHSSTDAAGLEVCPTRTGVFVTMAIIVISIGLAWVGFSIKLRRVPNDGFYIKKELIMLALTCLVGVVLFLPLSTSASTRDLARDTFSLDALVAGLTGLAVVIVCLAYPLSKLHIPRPVDEDQETLTLEEVLKDRPAGRDAFREFLVSEFSVENILVLDDIERYKAMATVYARANPDKVKKSTKKASSGKSSNALHAVGESVKSLARPTSVAVGDEDDRKSTESAGEDLLVAQVTKEGVVDEKKLMAYAREIYARYIDQGAPDQVNLSSQTAGRLKAELQEKHGPDELFAGTLFDEVQHEVVALCRRDTFPRFCRSPIGQAFKTKLGKAQDKEFRIGLVKHFCKLFAVFCLICTSTVGGLCGGGGTG